MDSSQPEYDSEDKDAPLDTDTSAAASGKGIGMLVALILPTGILNGIALVWTREPLVSIIVCLAGALLLNLWTTPHHKLRPLRATLTLLGLACLTILSWLATYFILLLIVCSSRVCWS